MVPFENVCKVTYEKSSLNQNVQAKWQRFGFEFHLRSSPSALAGIWISVDQMITSQLATPCWRDPARSKQLSTFANLGFQFGRYRVAPLSFLLSISLASLITSSIFLSLPFVSYFWSNYDGPKTNAFTIHFFLSIAITKATPFSFISSD